MVFCCIAIVGVASIYFCGLWIRQIICGPGKDPASRYPPPPRALTGHSALPVYGHTRLFAKFAGDVALLFPDSFREINWLPKAWTRKLGDCFSMFIWGQWRIAIKGPERANKILNTGTPLKDGWPWTPPIALLGKSCLCFMEDEEAQEQLKRILRTPLSYSAVLRYARDFAKHAERTVSDIEKGRFRRNHIPPREPSETSDNVLHDESTSDNDEIFHKVKWDALRSYTLDLIDGPVLAIHMWESESVQADQKKKPPSRDTMLLYLERMKLGLDVIKMTFGPEWMYVWIMNEYGRAINARMHIERVFDSHVAKLALEMPVKRQRGHAYHDPATQFLPLLTLRDNLLRSTEDVFGDTTHQYGRAQRPRSFSLPNMEESRVDSGSEYADVYNIEQDLSKPISPIRQHTSPDLCSERHSLSATKAGSPDCVIDLEEFVEHGMRPCDTIVADASSSFDAPAGRPRVLFASQLPPPKPPTHSIFEQILLQKDEFGNGLSHAVSTEIAIMLWMMMDVGNAWTAMALNLLSTDKEACDLIQGELDRVERECGDLYSCEGLGQMKYMDALIYEAIRLCPPFLGGLKVMSETVELEDDHLHIAKGSHIFFCQPTDRDFDILRAVGKRPERLGRTYPSIELFGFLPFQGIEVPLMVLQTKAFLIVALKRFTPCVAHPKTLIQRVRASVRIRSGGAARTKSEGSETVPDSCSSLRRFGSEDDLEAGFDPNDARSSNKMKPNEAMKMFTKIPFPEPRRSVQIRPRYD